MLTQFSRTELLFGKEAMDKLAGSKVAAELAVMYARRWSEAVSEHLT